MLVVRLSRQDDQRYDGKRLPAVHYTRINESYRASFELAALILRGRGRTLCPSDVARALTGDDGFRALMPHVREAAARLADRGELAVTQHGAPADARTARGPFRLGLLPDDARASSAAWPAVGIRTPCRTFRPGRD